MRGSMVVCGPVIMPSVSFCAPGCAPGCSALARSLVPMRACASARARLGQLVGDCEADGDPLGALIEELYRAPVRESAVGHPVDLSADTGARAGAARAGADGEDMATVMGVRADAGLSTRTRHFRGRAALHLRNTLRVLSRAQP